MDSKCFTCLHIRDCTVRRRQIHAQTHCMVHIALSHVTTGSSQPENGGQSQSAKTLRLPHLAA